MDRIKQYQSAINRVVDLAFLLDKKVDSLYKWFYTEFSKEKIEVALSYITQEDLRQDLYVYILELIQSKKDIPYLNKLLVFKTIQILKRLFNYHTIIVNWEVPPLEKELLPIFNLYWLLESNNPLTEYERYILYLRLYKCYDINTISQILYQCRESISITLNKAIVTMKDYYYGN